MHPAGISPGQTSLDPQPAASGTLVEHTMNAAPTARSRRPSSKASNTGCIVTDGVRSCRRVVGRHCDNGICKRHCEQKGGCGLHPQQPGANLGDNIMHDLAGEIGMYAMPEQPPAMYGEHSFEGDSPNNVTLPMPPRTSEQIAAQEQRELDSALALSLEPMSSASYQYPSSSYNSGSGFIHSSTPSGSSTSLSVTAKLPVSMTPFPTFLSTFSSNMHVYDPDGISDSQPALRPAVGQPLQLVETSGDRAVNRAPGVQSMSSRQPIATIDARLSKQMSGAWLNQFEARDASRMQVIDDQATQKMLELRCQRQFILKFFGAVG
jgi:hypothetical protein